MIINDPMSSQTRREKSFCLRVFQRTICSILVAREIAAKWSRMLVQTSSKRQIKRETRPDWLATRIPFFFFILVWECPNCVQMPYPAGTRFDCHKQWIFLYRTVFWGLIKPNCGTNVPKKNSKYTTLSHWVRYFSQTTASICLTPFPNCNTVEALVRGHPRDEKKVSLTGSGRLQEWISYGNSETDI